MVSEKFRIHRVSAFLKRTHSPKVLLKYYANNYEKQQKESPTLLTERHLARINLDKHFFVKITSQKNLKTSLKLIIPIK